MHPSQSPLGKGGSEGGFDVVIGNPPYVRQEMIGEFKDYFQGHYEVYHGTADLYAYFIEKGVSLLKKDGLFSYIVANKWMRANYGEPLRRWMKKQRIEEIIDFGSLPVFETATTYPCILRIRKGNPAPKFAAVQVQTLKFDSLDIYVSDNSYPVHKGSLSDKGWSLVNEEAQALLDKVRSKGVPLSDYVKGKIYYGIKTGLNEAFVINEETKERLITEDPGNVEVIKPFLVGKDIKRYAPLSSNRHLIFTRRGVDIKKFPVIEAHLLSYKKRLTPKPPNWKGGEWSGRKPGPYKWYEIQDTVDYCGEFEKPKIIWPGISAEVTAFAFDEERYYGNDNNQLIISDDRYLLGLLNSRLMHFVLTNTCDKVQGGFYRLKIVYIAQLPIRTIDFNNPSEETIHDKLVSLVDRMLDLHKKKASLPPSAEREKIEREIAVTDEKIDEIVYGLYGVTEEERGIIEVG
jgi:hypothetical protein